MEGVADSTSALNEAARVAAMRYEGVAAAWRPGFAPHAQMSLLYGVPAAVPLTAISLAAARAPVPPELQALRPAERDAVFARYVNDERKRMRDVEPDAGVRAALCLWIRAVADGMHAASLGIPSTGRHPSSSSTAATVSSSDATSAARAFHEAHHEDVKQLVRTVYSGAAVTHAEAAIARGAGTRRLPNIYSAVARDAREMLEVLQRSSARPDAVKGSRTNLVTDEAPDVA